MTASAEAGVALQVVTISYDEPDPAAVKDAEAAKPYLDGRRYEKAAILGEPPFLQTNPILSAPHPPHVLQSS